MQTRKAILLVIALVRPWPAEPWPHRSPKRSTAPDRRRRRGPRPQLARNFRVDPRSAGRVGQVRRPRLRDADHSGIPLGPGGRRRDRADHVQQEPPTISDQAKENLLDFVKDGKGFYVQHLASASFKEWDAFGKLCGRKWVMGTSGHGPRSVIAAKIRRQGTSVTKGSTISRSTTSFTQNSGRHADPRAGPGRLRLEHGDRTARIHRSMAKAE